MPTFAPVDAQFSANPLWNRTEREQEITLLPNGGFAILWNRSTPNDSSSAVFRRFDSDGSPAGDIIFAGFAGSGISAMDIAGLDDGGIVVAWRNSGSFLSFSVKTYNSQDQETGSFSIASPNSSHAFLIASSVEIEPLAGGGYVLTRSYQDGSFYWQQFDSMGQPVSPLREILPTPGWKPGFDIVDAEAFAGGGFAIAYVETSGASERILVKTYDAGWNVRSTTALVNQNSLAFASAVLADDLLLVVWSTTTGIFGQRLDASGNKVGPLIHVSSDVVSSLAVEAHPDGGFVVAWTDPSDSVDTSGSSIKAQAFTADGVKQGAEILVNNVMAGNQEDQDIAILPDGSLVVTWTTPELNPPPGQTSRDVAVRVFHDMSTPPIFVDGTSGDDRMEGTIRNEIFSGRAGHDLIFAGAGSDGLYGGEGDDYLDAGPAFSGRDFLAGGPGDDYMLVDSLDGVVENPGEGFDRVLALTSFALNSGAEIEMIIAHSEHVVYLVGNEFDQELIGNSGNNYLDGDGGRDRLFGAGGDDTYLVDSVDAVREDAGGGHDNVAARGSYALAELQEIEVLSTSDHQGTAPISLAGNEIGQRLIGNAGGNYLVGGGGADIFEGLGGNDSMIVDADDRIVEAAGGGHDNVASSTSFTLNAGAHVEVLSTTDRTGTAPINLTGNELYQSVIGNDGANVLDGGLGLDTMVGYGGADTFAFTTATINDNIDRIYDFVSGVDRIALDNAIFTGLAEGALPEAAFRIGAAAQDADDRILYDPTTGHIRFDPDGTGPAVAQHFATHHYVATRGDYVHTVASDFIVI